MTSPAVEAPRRGRPPKLSRDDVVEAALALIDTEGYDAVSVRRLAAELGVSTFAVQSHMGSKGELLDDVVMRLMAHRHTPIRAVRSWRAGVVAYASAMWELLLEHPAVLDVLEGHVASPDSVLEDLDRITELAARDGVSPAELAEVYETVWAFVLGYAATVHARAGIDEQKARAARATHVADRFPHAAQLASSLARSDRRASFARRLTALVEAL